MADPDDPLVRIAAALERLCPPPLRPADPLAHPAYVWDGQTLAPARHFAPLPLGLLLGVDTQKAALLATLARLGAGQASHDVLLWGAKGSGKSALVKSAVASVQAKCGALALVDVAADAMSGLPRLFAQLDGAGRGFAVFLDDLGFDTPGEARALRSLLEGGAEARPANVRLVVTANRRHLLPRDPGAESAAANPRDAADDALALADRFGLSLGFPVIDQDMYLAIIASYAAHHALAFDAGDALLWARQRGSRSGRVAWHYVVELAGRAGQSLG
ncbi:MAG: DUF815 domain-containing protein [Sphingomonas sp.]